MHMLCVQAGFLKIHEGRFFPRWNPGWFVLTQKELALYLVSGDVVEDTPSGVISMSQMVGCCSDGNESNLNTFKLSVIDNDSVVVWPLQATNDSEEREWKMVRLSCSSCLPHPLICW